MRLDFSVPETSLGKEWGKSTFCCFCFFMALRNHTVRNHLHFTSCHLSVTEMEEPSPNPLLRLISLDWGVNQLPINFYQNLSRVTVLFASTDMAFSKHAQLSGVWYPLCSAAERGGEKAQLYSSHFWEMLHFRLERTYLAFNSPNPQHCFLKTFL